MGRPLRSPGAAVKYPEGMQRGRAAAATRRVQIGAGAQLQLDLRFPFVNDIVRVCCVRAAVIATVNML